MLSLELPQRGDSNGYTQNTVSQYKNENHPKLSQICKYGICSKGLKNEFEAAVVNDPSLFQPLRFYCIWASVFEPLRFYCIWAFKNVNLPFAYGYTKPTAIFNGIFFQSNGYTFRGSNSGTFSFVSAFSRSHFLKDRLLRKSE